MSQLGLNKQLSSFKRGKRKLMKELGDNSHKFFVKNFDAQGFVNVPKKRWRPLKHPRRNGTTKPILVDTGKLKNSGKVFVQSRNRASVMFTAKYASFHNKGGGKLPKRQFSGESRVLNKQNEKIILNYIHNRLR